MFYRLLHLISVGAVLLLLLLTVSGASEALTSKTSTCADSSSGTPPSTPENTPDQTRPAFSSPKMTTRANGRGLTSTDVEAERIRGGGGKEEWPDLVGKSGEEAKAAILADDPKLTVHVLPDGSMVTMDFRLDRVRIFVDEEGKVVGTPRKG
mmetsp:Transcript_30910/g.67821  ORF Transcript_30910/g.67821 Transcript_30910/m.67821 type:complete len:152 (-) Transcript_30910:168-623(-)